MPKDIFSRLLLQAVNQANQFTQTPAHSSTNNPPAFANRHPILKPQDEPAKHLYSENLSHNAPPIPKLKDDLDSSAADRKKEKATSPG
jgi:hypothetical protein